jgi:methionyl-tRNA formyltransferase
MKVALVVTQPDRPQGRGAKLLPPPVKELANAHSIPVLQPERIKKGLDQFISDASIHGPFDVGVVIAFGQILPQAVLDLPRAGCVNVHASLLPRWRGAAPIQRAILAGDRETGVGLMKMEAGLDTGPVYAERRIDISAQDNLLSLHDRLGQEGAKLLSSELERIVRGELAPRTQPSEGVTYAAKVESAEAQIDWRQSAEQIDRVVRAFSPSPGAFTTLNGERLKIFKARAITPPHGASRDPGSIAIVDSRNLQVACGEGTLALEEVLLPGRKRLPVQEFLKGAPINALSILGR